MPGAEDIPPDVDLFTVLCALGSGLHADATPISPGAQHILANALLVAAAEECWSCAGGGPAQLLAAVVTARGRVAAPMALVPLDVADEGVLTELGVDPAGPTDVPGLIAAGLATEVVTGLVLLARPAGRPARRDGVRSVRIPLPGQDRPGSEP